MVREIVGEQNRGIMRILNCQCCAALVNGSCSDLAEARLSFLIERPLTLLPKNAKGRVNTMLDRWRLRVLRIYALNLFLLQS